MCCPVGSLWYLREKEKRRLDLRALRVCGQSYPSLNRLLWTTNTFDFFESRCFKAFFLHLNPFQKGNIRRLRITREVEGVHSSQFDDEWSDLELYRGDSPLIVGLQGLRNLYLVISRHTNSVEYYRDIPKSNTQRLGLVSWRSIPTWGFSRLEARGGHSVDQRRLSGRRGQAHKLCS